MITTRKHNRSSTARRAGCVLVFAGLVIGTHPVIAAPQDSPDDSDGLESEQSARDNLMTDVRAYQQRIEAAETAQGAFAPGLSEDLLGLGVALQRNGDHAAAVAVFKRGVHLSRINEGLDSSRQLALLKGEIASHVALGSLEEADERQRYLYRVEAKTLSDVTRGQALIQHALWQRQAYEAGVGEEPYGRLLNMWSLYRLALTELAQAEGDTSPTLLPALYGMLQAQYLISGFVGETTNGQFRTRGVYGEELTQQMGYRSQSFKQGRAVIRAIYDVKTSQANARLEDTAELMLMLGDWQLWHGKRNDALDTYAELYGELAETDAAKELRQQMFGSPSPLPQLAGVRAFPDPVDEGEGRLLLEFGVTDRGKVVDVVRLDNYAPNNQIAEDVIFRLRGTPFRPRFDDGMPVDTKGLRWAYETSSW